MKSVALSRTQTCIPGFPGQVPYRLYEFTPEKIIIYLINISELRNACLDDCRQSSTSVHAHCLRNEQCACAYDLNKQDGHW